MTWVPEGEWTALAVRPELPSLRHKVSGRYSARCSGRLSRCRSSAPLSPCHSGGLHRNSQCNGAQTADRTARRITLRLSSNRSS
jgi:hypothetical protein